MEATPSTIRNPLRRERLRQGLTQLELAVVAGCSMNSISIAERGGKISSQMAERLAGALGVPVETISALRLPPKSLPRQDEPAARELVRHDEQRNAAGQ